MRRTGEASDCAYIILSQHLLHRSEPRLLGAGQRGLLKQARPFRGGSLTDGRRWILLVHKTIQFQISSENGNFIALYTEPNPDKIRARTSNPFSSLNLFSTNLFTSSPTRYYHGSSEYGEAILFEDHEAAETKGILLEQPKSSALNDPAQLRLLPLADGTYRIETKVGSTSYFGIRSGNDFEVMETFLCQNLLMTKKWPCEPCQSNSDCPLGQFCQTDQRCQ